MLFKRMIMIILFAYKKSVMYNSGRFKLFVNGNFTKHFLFPVLWYFPLGLNVMHVSIMFSLSAMTPPELHLIFGSTLFVDFFTFEPISRGELYIQNHLVVQKLWYKHEN